MSKKSRRNKKNSNQQNSQQGNQPYSRNDNKQDPNLGEMENKHREVITPELAKELDQIPNSKDFTTQLEKGNVEQTWKKLSHLWKLHEIEKNKYQQLLEKVEEKEKALDESRAAHEKKLARLEKLDHREEFLEIKIKEAEKGFTEVNSRKRSLFEEEKREFREHRVKQLSLDKDEVLRLELEYDQKVEAARKDLVKDTQEIKDKERELRKKQALLEEKEEILEEDMTDFKERKAEYLDDRLEKAQWEIESLHQRKAAVEELLRERDKRIESLYAKFQDWGHKNPEEVDAKLKELMAQKEELEKKLDTYLPPAKREKLELLEKEVSELEEDNFELRDQKRQLESQYKKTLIEIAEKQELQERIANMQKQIEMRQTMLEELRAEVGEYTQKAKEKVTFQYCVSMDKDTYLQSGNRKMNPFQDLKELSSYLRSEIAVVEETPLFYSKQMIRTFLGGLAMSPLTLLQGISGTGKTSLPRAFAKAIGGPKAKPFKIVEVQSGWRDQQDLMGFFNTFESKYYESKFLKALYEASTPRYRNLPYFIILDEMNLSHPEHYFAALLSQMENEPGKRELEIIAATDRIPKLMDQRGDGLFLPLPPNVRFIGTANHDETTLQFAPKTYDRSNVIQIPRNRESEFPRADKQNRILTYDNLDNLFTQAQQNEDRITEVNIAKNFLKTQMGKLVKPLGIGWGNRLEKHLRNFMPVVVEAGGTPGEALDHLIATKIFRTLENQIGFGARKLETLQEEFQSAFDELEIGEPTQCLHLLEKEIERLKEDGE